MSKPTTIKKQSSLAILQAHMRKCGLTDHTALVLLCDFIKEQDLIPELQEFLDEAAEDFDDEDSEELLNDEEDDELVLTGADDDEWLDDVSREMD